MSSSMRFVAMGLIVVFAGVAIAQPPDPSELPIQPFLVEAKFEQDDPIRFWKSKGAFKVNFKGLTDEIVYDSAEYRQFFGARCFKLDITFSEDGECFWRLPWSIPADDRPYQTIHMRLGRHSNADEIGAGYALIFFPSDHYYWRELHTERGAPTAQRAQKWRKYTDDFMFTPSWPADTLMSETKGGKIGKEIAGVEQDDIGLMTEAIIRIKGRAGQRAVVYLDNMRLEGRASDPDAFREAVMARYNRAAAPLHRQWRDARKRLTKALAQMREMEDLPEGLQVCKEALEKGTAHQLLQVERLIERGWGGWKEIDPVTDTAWAVERSVGALRELAKLDAAPDVVTYRIRTATNTPVLPTEAPSTAALGDPVKVAACRGEIEPASFAVYAIKNAENLTLEISDLKGPAVIAAKAIDPFVIKAWWVSGYYSGDPIGRFLVPDLLLKDDALVRVDYQNQHNYLRSTAEDGTETYVLSSGPTSKNLAGVLPRQPDTLQPVTIPAGTTKQFWLTVHVPEDAAPGDYSGTITLRWGQDKTHRLPLHLKVHDFELPPCPLTHSVFNRGGVADDAEADPNNVNSEALTVEQYEREIRNQVLHGVLHPNSYDGFRNLRKALDARKRAGVANDRFFCLYFWRTGWMEQAALGDHPNAPSWARGKQKEAMANILKGIPEWQAILKEYGYEELYIMGVDEARGWKLAAERPVFEAIRKTGAKIWAAQNHVSTFDVAGDMMDMAVMSAFPKPSEAKKWHSVGHEVFCLGSPMTEWDQPEIFRRNFGLALWKADYDGAMHYAYRHAFGHIWNDFDNERRDHSFVYPTVGGLIDTIAWEGVREGIDDTRYVTALEQAIENAKDRKLADEAQAFLDELSPVAEADLNATRARIVTWIEKLK